MLRMTVEWIVRHRKTNLETIMVIQGKDDGVLDHNVAVESVSRGQILDVFWR